MSTDPGVWLAAIGTLAAFSYLYNENPLSRFFEYTMIGFTVAQLSVAGYHNIMDMAVKPFLSGEKPMALIPIILGLLLYTRWIKGKEWLSRIPIALMMSVAAALTITGAIHATVIPQLRATMVPIKGPNELFLLIGVVGTLSYFFFVAMPGDSADGTRKGVLGKLTAALSYVGRYTMMVAFGASFGAGVMSRIGLFIGRLQFLFGDWIPLIK